ncbi:protein TPX2-like isoform X2 [Lotus japonicus]|uniref:protein TPX2-like isoform X2 n=2 Tax=Lotus japonicus TaxID=34305 RepID=UPI0025842D68|nr:protein TPX2-like isoform X2 [Lotus japonicus]XP_057446405.1 protein TPX2-like isoform X2 [Lotus japonicus]
MEEEFDKVQVSDPSMCGDDHNEIDLDYEFDAPRFFDFTRPETFWDADEAQQWFEFAASYPPSPFLEKLRWGNAGAMENVNIVANDDSGPCVNPEQGLEYCNATMQDTLNGNTKLLSKSSSLKSKVFTFMKPTASHLAKQKNAPEVQPPRYFRRLQKQNSSIDGELTKRQKLEAGYLQKVARLKHQTLFTHKKTKEVDRKPNVTIPREPNLVTASRAQRHKSRTNVESVKHTKSSSRVIKAQSLSKKVLEGLAQPFRKMKTPQPTEFQVFHLKTSERALQHAASSNAGGTLNCNSLSNSETKDLKRTKSSVGSRQEKCKMISKLRGSLDDRKLSSKRERGVFRNIKVFPVEPNDERFENELPTELFSKLSLASEAKKTTKSPSVEQPISKGLKENRPESLRQKHEMNLIREEIQRLCTKQYQCE